MQILGSRTMQVAGLIFFVAGAGMVDVGEAVEGELAVAFETRD